MKRLMSVLRRVVRPSVGSVLLTLAGMGALVAFAGTFGVRWALLAAVPCLLVLGAAVDGDS